MVAAAPEVAEETGTLVRESVFVAESVALPRGVVNAAPGAWRVREGKTLRASRIIPSGDTNFFVECCETYGRMNGCVAEVRGVFTDHPPAVIAFPKDGLSNLNHSADVRDIRDAVDAQLQLHGWVIARGYSQFAKKRINTEIRSNPDDYPANYIDAFGDIYLVRDPDGNLWELPPGIYASDYAKRIATGEQQLPEGCKNFREFQRQKVAIVVNLNDLNNYAGTNYVQRKRLDRDVIVIPFLDSKNDIGEEWIIRRDRVDPSSQFPEGIMKYLKTKFDADVKVSHESDGEYIEIIYHGETPEIRGWKHKYLLGFTETSAHARIEHGTHLQLLAEAFGVSTDRIRLMDKTDEPKKFVLQGKDVPAVQHVKRLSDEEKEDIEKEGWCIFEHPEHKDTVIVRRNVPALRQYLAKYFPGSHLQKQEPYTITCSDWHARQLTGSHGWRIKKISHEFFGDEFVRIISQSDAKNIHT